LFSYDKKILILLELRHKQDDLYSFLGKKGHIFATITMLFDTRLSNGVIIMGFKDLRYISVTMVLCGALFTPTAFSNDDQIENADAIHTQAGCEALAEKYGQTAFVHVRNIRSEEGNVRVEIYANNEEEFLKGDMRLNRVDVPSIDYERDVCLILPGVEKYALVVIHDRNANDKADFFTEGFGFSNNVQLKLSKPKLDEVAFQAKPGVNKMDIDLSYMFVSDHDKEEKRRKFRRR
jgi:uncharacterized protein (DUF2141 family)